MQNEKVGAAFGRLKAAMEFLDQQQPGTPEHKKALDDAIKQLLALLCEVGSIRAKTFGSEADEALEKIFKEAEEALAPVREFFGKSINAFFDFLGEGKKSAPGDSTKAKDGDLFVFAEEYAPELSRQYEASCSTGVNGKTAMEAILQMAINSFAKMKNAKGGSADIPSVEICAFAEKHAFDLAAEYGRMTTGGASGKTAMSIILQTALSNFFKGK